MVLSWQKYYEKFKHIGDINEVAAQYNMYVYQNQEQYDEELIRKMGNNSRYILQEEPYNYIILQEGKNEYGILQEY
jgi:hypothetical protein